jgi:flagellar biosynthesis/type III secretory pathway protein FliH
VIKLWERSPDELRRLGLLPLMPFARGVGPEEVRQAQEELGAVEPEDTQAELQAILALFAGNVFPAIDWLARIPREIVMKSTVFDRLEAMGRAKGLAEGEAKGLAAGKAEGKAEAIVNVLEARFGSVPERLQKRLRALQEPKVIAKLLKLAATCEALSVVSRALPAKAERSR